MNDLNDLMELITSSPIDKTLHSFRDEQVILELRELGFDSAIKASYADLARRQKHARITAYNYPVVTNDAIEKFLERTVEIYNLQNKSNHRHNDSHDMVQAILSIDGEPIGFTIDRIVVDSQLLMGALVSDSKVELIFYCSKKTNDYYNRTGIGQFIYEEVLVQDYPNIPPRAVLEKLREHKARNIFDTFTIGYVKGIPDPVLFGRIREDNERRWFIAQWGNDVCLDDLI